MLTYYDGLTEPPKPMPPEVIEPMPGCNYYSDGYNYEYDEYGYCVPIKKSDPEIGAIIGPVFIMIATVLIIWGVYRGFVMCCCPEWAGQSKEKAEPRVVLVVRGEDGEVLRKVPVNFKQVELNEMGER